MPETFDPAKERYDRITAFVSELNIDGLEELGMVLHERYVDREDEDAYLRAEMEVLSRITPAA